MAFVLCATQPWGVIQDRAGNVRREVPVAFDVPLYADDAGAVALTAVQSKTDASGRIPGYIEAGERTVEYDGQTFPVEALSAAVIADLATTVQTVESGMVLSPQISHSGPDGMRVTDAAMTAASATLSTASHTFTNADRDKIVIVFGAGPGGRTLTTTILSVSSGNATLADAAATTVSGAVATWGTDNTDDLQDLIDQASAGSAAWLTGGATVWITGGQFFAERLTLQPGMTIQGTEGACIQQHSKNILADAALAAADPFGTQGLIGYNSHGSNFVLGKVAIRNITLRGEGQKTANGYQQAAIWISQGGEDVTVDNTIISDFYAAGIYAPNVRRLKVSHCYVGNVGYANGYNAIDAGVSSYKSDGDDLKDVTITGNTVENCPAAGICYQPFKNVGVGHFTITDNHVRNCGWVGIVAEGGYVNGGTIKGNVVESSLWGYAVLDSHSSSSALDQLQSVVLQGNVCKSGTCTVTQLANTTNTNTTITVAATFGTEMVGAAVSGPGIQVGTTIAAKLTGTTYQLSLPATATATNVYITFASARNYGAIINSSKTVVGGNVLEGRVMPALQIAGNNTTSRRIFGVRATGNHLHHESSDSSASDRNGLRVFYASEPAISGNTFTFAGSGAHKGMYLSDVLGGGADDNTITGAGWHGALIEDAQGFAWGSNNKVYDWNQSTQPDGAAVKLIGTTSGSGSYLKANTYHDRTAKGVYGVWNASTATWYEDGETVIGATTRFFGNALKRINPLRSRPLTLSRRGLPGVIAPEGCAHTSSQLLVANRIYVMRFRTDDDWSTVSLAFNVNTAATVDDQVDVGIYSVTGNDTLTKLVALGPTTGLLNSTGLKTPSVAAALAADTTYYAAIGCGAVGGTAATLIGDNTANGLSQAFGATYGLCLADAISSAWSSGLPATLTRASGTASSVPWVAVRSV